jgi:hypothetical protein
VAPPIALLSEVDDLSTFADDGTVGIRFTKKIRGVRCVLEWVARRWLSRPGSLVWALDTRINLADLINADPRAGSLKSIERVLEEEALRVAFVRRCQPRVTLDAAGVLSAVGGVEVYDSGVYPLIVTIDKAKAAVKFPPTRATG